MGLCAIMSEENKYTHIDKDGMLWRWEGCRPISKLADEVMAEVVSLHMSALNSLCDVADAMMGKQNEAQTIP